MARLLGVIPATIGAQATMPFDPPARTELPRGGLTIPLTRVDGFYYLDVRLNGRPFRFTLETGANVFAVSARAARTLGLRIDSAEVRPGSRAAVARVDSLTLGGERGAGVATFRGLTAGVIPGFGGDFDGIVSVSVLRDVLATIDLGGGTLRLAQGALPDANGRDVLPFAGQDRGGRVDLAVDVGGVTLPAVIDTRSSFWIILPDSLEARLPLASPPRFVTQAAGPSLGTFTLRGARLGGMLRVGPVSFERAPMMLRDRPGVVLGVPLLEHVVLTLDQRNRRLRVVPRGEARSVTVPPQPWESATVEAGATSAATPAGPRVSGAVPAPGQWTLGFGLAGQPGAPTLRVASVFPGSNAAQLGITVGDEIAEIAGTPAAELSPTVTRAAAARGEPLKIVVLRDGARRELTIRPYQIPAPTPATVPASPATRPDDGDVRAEVEALAAAMVAAFKRDPASVAAFYLDDVGGSRTSPWVRGRSTLIGQGGRRMATDFLGALRRAPDGALRFLVDMYVPGGAER